MKKFQPLPFYLMSIWLALWSPLLGAQGSCPSGPASERFSVQGSEVSDLRTGLIWSRCSAGQSWDGDACSGSYSLFTHKEAMAYAQRQSGWRLPEVQELTSLIDKGCHSPVIDTTVFSNTPAQWFWTSTSVEGDPNLKWGVFFDNGYVNAGYVNYRGYAVRLVRVSR